MPKDVEYELEGNMLTIWVKRGRFTPALLPGILEDILYECWLSDAERIRTIKINNETAS